MSNIIYLELQFNKCDILDLYLDNEWTNYTNEKEDLFAGIRNSLYSYGAYDEDGLIGMIRVVGDGKTIIYIQDILVLKKYQGQGIGTTLINHIIEKYKDVRQMVLSTDKSVAQKAFYQKNGFEDYGSLNLVAFMLNKKEQK